MNLKKITFLFAMIILAMSGMKISAQGIVIYQNDGTRIDVPYSKLDSIVTYDVKAPEQSEDNWVSLGMVTVSDDFILPLFSYSPVTYQVEIQENQNTPGIYRLVNLFGEAWGNACANEGLGVPYSTENLYIEINAQDPDGVYFSLQSTGVDLGYGVMSIGSMGWYYMNSGNSFDAVKDAGYMGTLVDGVISFPVNGCFIADNDGTYYANNNGTFKITLPSETIANYSVEDASVKADKIHPLGTIEGASQVIDWKKQRDLGSKLRIDK